MKSSNPSLSPFRRALVAAAVVLATGNVAVLAQTSSSQGSSSRPGSSSGSYNSQNSANQSSTNTAGSSSMNTNDTDMSSSSSQASTMRSEKDKLSWGDKRFVTKAAEDGQKEVKIAQLAVQKATNPDVKQFAQQMVDQHTQVNSQLMTIASSKNVKIDESDAEDRDYRRLSRASGEEFDREFVQHMVDEHEKDVKRFQKAAEDAKDAEVRQFASSTLQHLQQHLSQAQQLQQSVIPTGRSSSDSWRSDTPSSSATGTTGSDMGAGSTSGQNTAPGSESSSGASTGASTTGTATTP